MIARRGKLLYDMFKDKTDYDGSDCGTCQLCCHNMRINGLQLSALDDPNKYDSRKDEAGDFWLAVKKNGDCTYCDRRTGCTIHGAHPLTCKSFDCMVLIMLPTIWGTVPVPVFKKGLKRGGIPAEHKKEALSLFLENKQACIRQARKHSKMGIHPTRLSKFYEKFLNPKMLNLVLGTALTLVENNNDIGFVAYDRDKL